MFYFLGSPRGYGSLVPQWEIETVVGAVGAAVVGALVGTDDGMCVAPSGKGVGAGVGAISPRHVALTALRTVNATWWSYTVP